MKRSVMVRLKAMLSAVLAEAGFPEVKYKTYTTYRGSVVAAAYFWPSLTFVCSGRTYMRINGDPAVDAGEAMQMLLLGAWSVFKPLWMLSSIALRCRRLRPR